MGVPPLAWALRRDVGIKRPEMRVNAAFQLALPNLTFPQARRREPAFRADAPIREPLRLDRDDPIFPKTLGDGRAWRGPPPSALRSAGSKRLGVCRGKGEASCSTR